VRVGHQIAIIAAAVAAYFGVRGATEAAYGEALHNAHLLVELERLLGVYWEPALQDSLVDSPRVASVLNGIYIYGHWPVIVVSLLWLARRHPAVYYRTRNGMLISGAIGLVLFVSFPVAPPRLAGLGMTDTISVASDAYRVLQPTAFTNQYAAMPSLHVGWDLLIGLGLAAALRRPLLRALAMAMPVAMAVTVVLTANHYLVDAVAGAALTTFCWFAAGTLARRFAARPSAVDVRPAPTRPPAPRQAGTPRGAPARHALPAVRSGPLVGADRLRHDEVPVDAGRGVLYGSGLHVAQVRRRVDDRQ
jgi:membrane-associated phospholipid phosphatase